MLKVIEPGLYSSIQDAGRPGWGHLGVRHAGAADALALAAANLLAGNAPHAPALEMTLLGASFEVRSETLVGIAGADMEAHVPEEGRDLPPGGSYRLRAGSSVRFGGALDGARTYLAQAGGIEVPQVLGSAATDPIAGFGGVEGRPLQAGDVLSARGTTGGAEHTWPEGSSSSGIAAADGPRTITVVAGPHRGFLSAAVSEALSSSTWTVTPRSDRVGLRLAGPPIAAADSLDLASLPMLPGAVQLPANGQPIVLMPDAPTVGGYPVPAVVAEVDRAITGQLRPGDELRFEWIDLETARERARRQRARLRDLAVSLA